MKVCCLFCALCVAQLTVPTYAQEPAPATAAPPAAAEPAAADPAAAPAAEPAAAEPVAVGGTPETPLAKSAAAAPAPEQATTETTLSEEEQPEKSEPNLSLSVQLGTGYMMGAAAASLAPITADFQVLTVREPRYLIGGALRVELGGANAVAGIFRFQLRHPFGPIELRPSIGVPFYIAPRTMLGAEAGAWGRLALSGDLSLLAAISAAALVMGDDIPKGSTVIMLQLFVGAELFI
jgi:hypothetical protein